MAAVRAAFKPEFINRLDDVIIFDALQPDELVQIVDIQLAQLQKRLAQRRLTLEVSLPAKQWLAERGFDPLYGARPLRRLIQQAIGDQLAKMLLAGEVHDGDVVPVNVSADGEGRLAELVISACFSFAERTEARRSHVVTRCDLFEFGRNRVPTSRLWGNGPALVHVVRTLFRGCGRVAVRRHRPSTRARPSP